MKRLISFQLRLLVLVGLTLGAGIAFGAEGTGKLYLVGMGPGDPDLATVRAVRIVKQADKVFCSASMEKTLASMAKPDALELMDGVLAKRHYSALKQKDANDVEPESRKKRQQFAGFIAKIRGLVQQGQQVAIVDGGDPLIFGAWSWVTAEFDDVALEVVPGVSSFNAANAALCRDVMWGGRRCVVLSGGDVLGLPPQEGRMASPTVFFTHRNPLNKLLPRLRQEYPTDTPIAVVLNAGHKDSQRVVRATLATIEEELGQEELPFLNLVYVGDILTLDCRAIGGGKTAGPSPTLSVIRQGKQDPEQIEFRKTITEKGEDHVCFCSAMLFRMMQLAAKQRGDVFNVNEIDSVRTGWPSHASGEILCELLAMPEDKLFLSDELVDLPKPAVRKAWWEFRFKDGKVITLIATDRILPKDFLALRSKHKKGDNSEATTQALQARKEQLVAEMNAAPLEQSIVVRTEKIAPDPLDM